MPNIIGDALIDNNFQRLYNSCTQTLHSVIFTNNNKPIEVLKLKAAIIHHNIDFVRRKRGEEVISLTRRETALNIKEISIQEEIQKEQEERCKNLYGEDPLKFWHKDKSIAKIDLIDPNKIIRVKQMVYTYNDIEEFRKELEDLKRK